MSLAYPHLGQATKTSPAPPQATFVGMLILLPSGSWTMSTSLRSGVNATIGLEKGRVIQRLPARSKAMPSQ